MTEYPSFFKEWRVADRAARAVEAEMLKASLLALDGRGNPPTLGERAHAKELREVANDLLRLAMVEVDAKANTMRGNSLHARPFLDAPACRQGERA